MVMTEVPQGLLQFSERWLQADRRLLLAAQFARDAAERVRFLAVQSLIGEFCEAAVAVSDARVGELKLAWWHNEAERWSAGESMHPLLSDWPAPATASALGGMALAALDWMRAATPTTKADALTALLPLASTSMQLAEATPASLPHWQLLWFTRALRLSTTARAPLATVIPLDIWARHSVRRSEVATASDATRTGLLADCAALVMEAGDAHLDAPTAAYVQLEQRWLRRACARLISPLDRVGVRDVWTAWRAARQSHRR